MLAGGVRDEKERLSRRWEEMRGLEGKGVLLDSSWEGERQCSFC